MYEKYKIQNMIPTKATGKNGEGKLCLAFLFRVSLCLSIHLTLLLENSQLLQP